MGRRLSGTTFGSLSMLLITRKLWFRMLVAITSAALGGGLLLSSPSSEGLRANAATALQAVTLLFSVMTALALVLYFNYVKGLRDTYVKQVSWIRDRLEKFFDEYQSSDDEDIRTIIKGQIVPLLRLGIREWLAFDRVNALRQGPDGPFVRLHQRENWFLPRHLVRLEDEINELGLTFIRRIAVELYLKAIRAAFMLVVVGMMTIALARLLPSNRALDALLVMLSVAVIASTIVETLHLLSYLVQLAREEVDELHMPEEEAVIAEQGHALDAQRNARK